MTTTQINPFLQGNFAPVNEEITRDNLEVIGEIPLEIEGIFVRNGANPQFPNPERYHWFMGDGMLHKIQLQQGQAYYQNRYVQTKGWKMEKEAGRALSPEELPRKNTANTALVHHGGKLLALWEGGEPHFIQETDLVTIGTYNFNGQLVSPFTAHPKVDPVTGEMMFFGYSMVQPPYLTYGWVSPQGNIEKVVNIDLPIGVMMHDFAITEKYTIFMDLPLTFRPERLQNGESGFKFEHDLASRFGIMPRHDEGANIRWFESDPCYVFHTLNAYEEGEEVVLIACRMSSTSALGLFETDDPTGDIPKLYQWRFNLKTGESTEKVLCEIPSEFPRINEQYLGRKTRYGYTGKISDSPLSLMDGIIKHDFFNDSLQIHQFESESYGGEPVFVPHSQGKTEDEGWLVTFVHNNKTNTSYLIILDAQNIADDPVAKIILPQRVPYGFHGIWLSQETLRN